MANALLIEPNHYLREGLRAVVHNDTGRLVGAVASARSISRSATPDVLLFGPGTIDVIEAELDVSRERLAVGRDVPAVMLMDTTDSAAVRRVSALGLDAILSPDISADVLLRSLDLVVLGQQIFPASAAEPRLVPLRSGSGNAAASLVYKQKSTGLRDSLSDVVLSEREMQTLRGLVNGASNKTIAQQLLISESTVKAHVKSLLRKMRVTNRTQVVLWALSNQEAWTARSDRADIAATSREVSVLQVPDKSMALPALEPCVDIG